MYESIENQNAGDAQSAAAPMLRPIGEGEETVYFSDTDSSLSEELFREYECFSEDDNVI